MLLIKYYRKSSLSLTWGISNPPPELDHIFVKNLCALPSKQKYDYLIPHYGLLKIKYWDHTRASPGGDY